MEEDQETLSFGLVACVAIFAFWISPALRFADPASLIIPGGVLALGAAASWLDVTDRMVGGSYPWVSYSVFAIGFGLLAVVMFHAQAASRLNDDRCAAIQRMMLAPNPVRSDGPDLFQALQCRPQNLPFTEWPTKVRRRPEK